MNQNPPATPPSRPKRSVPRPIATPKRPISWAEIASRPVIAPKPSCLPIPTPNPILKCTETAPDTRPAAPRKLAPKHQKPYLTIEDLIEMFAEKPKRTDLLRTKHNTKNRAPSPLLSRQAKIISYFRPAATKKALISQVSETPSPMSFRQHMTAEVIRIKSIPPTEKSSVLSYRMPSISCLCKATPSPEISSVLPYRMPSISLFVFRNILSFSVVQFNHINTMDALDCSIY